MKGGAVNPGDLKGHLGLRSSPLAPTASKLSSQYIVLDHLNAHYRMINNAKSTIDNKAPKAWTSSTKMRDRERRSVAKKGGDVSGARYGQNSRPNSRMSVTSRQSLVDQIKAYEDYFEEDPEVGAVVRSTLPQHHSSPEQDIYIERANTEDMKFVNRMVADSYNNPNTYKSPRAMRSMIPDGMKAGSGNPNVSTPRRGIAGDLLDDHSHKFKESRPFTPRTLNTKNVKSKLSQFKYYNPPKKRTASSKSGGKEVKEEKFERTETMNTMATTQDLTFEPLRSKDFKQLSSHREKSANIPRLDISIDQDHMVWLSEQAKKAQVRVGSARQEEKQAERATLNHSTNLNYTAGLNGTAGMNNTGGLRTSDTMRTSGTYKSGMRANDIVTASDTLASHRSLGMSHTMQKVDTEEEELQYLEFVSDITSDVLERGIFTNRVLKQVFEHHLNEKKNILKISRMRALLEKLREDLGIPESDGEGEEDFGLKSHVKMSDADFTHEVAGPPKPQPRAQARHKFVKVNDEVDFKSMSGSERGSMASIRKQERGSTGSVRKQERGSTGYVRKQAEAPITRNVENGNFSEPPKATISKDMTDHSHIPQTENHVVSDAVEIEEEESVREYEQNSMMSEQEESVTSNNMDEMSTIRSLPQEHKWMNNKSNFTMTLKPGQLDMTLVKPKPRSRDRQRLAETVPANPRARRRDIALHKDDDLGTTGEMSTLTDVTAISESEIHKEEKLEVSSVASDATLKNGSEKGSQRGSNPGSRRGSAHGSNASIRAAKISSENGSVKGSRHASPRGSVHGSTTGSVHVHNAQASEQGSTGTLRGSLEGSTTFIMADALHSVPQESPRPSPRSATKESPSRSIKGSQASVHTVVDSSGKNEMSDVDSVFSDHFAGLDSEPEGSTKGGRAAPAYSKKSPHSGNDADDDEDF